MRPAPLALAPTLAAALLGCGAGDPQRPSDNGGVTLAPVEGRAVPAAGQTPVAAPALAAREQVAAARANQPPREFIPGEGSLAVGLTAPAVLRTRPGGPVIARLRSQTEFGSPRVLPVVARRGRWVAVLASDLANDQRGWLRLGTRAELFRPGWTVVIDLSDRELVARRGKQVLRRMVVAIGQTSTPTPPGLYGVTDKLIARGGKSVYGYGALALSGHQPRIRQGWGGGDRLAVHGTHDPASIGQAVSLGCLRASRDDVRWLVAHVPLGSRVRVRE